MAFSAAPQDEDGWENCLMNYRHAYHAGNHGDVLKHIVLTLIAERLKAKEAPFRAYDAYGGIGLYDLASIEAEKTLEWQSGAGLLFDVNGEGLPLCDEAEAFLAPWRACVSSVNVRGALTHYPGSPEILLQCLRREDRLRLNELHPADFATLAASFESDQRAAVTQLDARVFIKSQLPPPERRGLILIDPPYEKTNETDHVIGMLKDGLKRFASGVFVLWYPVTGDGLDKRLRDGVEALGPLKITEAEILVREAKPDGGLAGSGLIIVNPPWRLGEALGAIMAPLADRLSQGHHGARLESRNLS